MIFLGMEVTCPELWSGNLPEGIVELRDGRTEEEARGTHEKTLSPHNIIRIGPRLYFLFGNLNFSDFDLFKPVSTLIDLGSLCGPLLTPLS